MKTWTSPPDVLGGRVAVGVLLVWVLAAVMFIVAVTPVSDQATQIQHLPVLEATP